MTTLTHHYRERISQHRLDRTCRHQIARTTQTTLTRQHRETHHTQRLQHTIRRPTIRSTAHLLSRPSPRDHAQSTVHQRPRSIRHSKVFLKQRHFQVRAFRERKLIRLQERVLEMDCAMEQEESLHVKDVQLTTTAGTRVQAMIRVRMEARWRESNRQGPFDRPNRQDRLEGLPVPFPSMRPQSKWSVYHQRRAGNPVHPRQQRHCRSRHQQLQHKQFPPACLVAIAEPVRHRSGGETRKVDRSATLVVSCSYIPRHS
jgi:hypothetical protein